jgi:hypothetical protein
MKRTKTQARPPKAKKTPVLGRKASRKTALLITHKKMNRNQPSNNGPSTINKPSVNGPNTNNQPSTNGPSTINLPSNNGPIIEAKTKICAMSKRKLLREIDYQGFTDKEWEENFNNNFTFEDNLSKLMNRKTKSKTEIIKKSEKSSQIVTERNNLEKSEKQIEEDTNKIDKIIAKKTTYKNSDVFYEWDEDSKYEYKRFHNVVKHKGKYYLTVEWKQDETIWEGQNIENFNTIYGLRTLYALTSKKSKKKITLEAYSYLKNYYETIDPATKLSIDDLSYIEYIGAGADKEEYCETYELSNIVEIFKNPITGIYFIKVQRDGIYKFCNSNCLGSNYDEFLKKIETGDYKFSYMRKGITKLNMMLKTKKSLDYINQSIDAIKWKKTKNRSSCLIKALRKTFDLDFNENTKEIIKINHLNLEKQKEFLKSKNLKVGKIKTSFLKNAIESNDGDYVLIFELVNQPGDWHSVSIKSGTVESDDIYDYQKNLLTNYFIVKN